MPLIFESDRSQANYRTSFSGSDIRAIAYRPPYNVSDEENRQYDNAQGQYAEFGSIQTLSISSFREKNPVRSLGFQHAMSYVRGCFAANTDIVTSQGLKTISDIKPGDMVLSYNLQNNLTDFKPCLNIWPTGLQQTYNVCTASGKKLCLTADHRIYANGRWTRVKDLRPDDTVLLPLGFTFKESIEYNDDYLKLLAYAIGDGVFGSYKHGRELRYSLTPGVGDAKIDQEIDEI